MRRAEDSGQRQLDKNIIAVRAISYVAHMQANGIKPEQYNEVYESAVSIYNDQEIKGPFGVDYLVQAAKRMNEVTKQVVIFKRPNTKALASCSTCQGSKLSYKMEGSKIVGVNRNEDGSMMKCGECDGL